MLKVALYTLTYTSSPYFYRYLHTKRMGQKVPKMAQPTKSLIRINKSKVNSKYPILFLFSWDFFFIHKKLICQNIDIHCTHIINLKMKQRMKCFISLKIRIKYMPTVNTRPILSCTFNQWAISVTSDEWWSHRSSDGRALMYD